MLVMVKLGTYYAALTGETFSPAQSAPKIACIHSNELCPNSATVSPRRSPMSCRPAANRLARVARSLRVTTSSVTPSMNMTASGAWISYALYAGLRGKRYSKIDDGGIGGEDTRGK